MYIAIEGLPLSGKSRLTRALTKKRADWIPQFDLRFDQAREVLSGKQLDEYLARIRFRDADAMVADDKIYISDTSPLTSLVHCIAHGYGDEIQAGLTAALRVGPSPSLIVYIKPDIEKILRAARRKKVKVSVGHLLFLQQVYEDVLHIDNGVSAFDEILVIEPNFKPAKIQREIERRLKCLSK